MTANIDQGGVQVARKQQCIRSEHNVSQATRAAPPLDHGPHGYQRVNCMEEPRSYALGTPQPPPQGQHISSSFQLVDMLSLSLPLVSNDRLPFPHLDVNALSDS